MSRSLFTVAYGHLLNVLVEERKSSGLRQIDLAERLNKPQSFVSKIENGERRLDVIEFLVVARAMGADAHDLFATIVAEVPHDTTI